MKERQEFDGCANQLKALANADRLRLVLCLLMGASDVSNLCSVLGQEITKVSHHLGVLREAGLVQIERDGKHIIYSLRPDLAVVGRSGRLNKCVDLGCCRLDLNGR